MVVPLPVVDGSFRSFTTVSTTWFCCVVGLLSMLRVITPTINTPTSHMQPAHMYVLQSRLVLFLISVLIAE